jgi:hypothetical protein
MQLRLSINQKAFEADAWMQIMVVLHGYDSFRTSHLGKTREEADGPYLRTCPRFHVGPPQADIIGNLSTDEVLPMMNPEMGGGRHCNIILYIF